MKKIVIKENDANQRIDKYLKKLLCNAPSNFIYKMFRKKDIKINGKKVNEKYIPGHFFICLFTDISGIGPGIPVPGIGYGCISCGMRGS